MKRLMPALALVMVLAIGAVLVHARVADIPRLTDAEKTTLLMAHRDFLSSLAQVNQTETECKTKTDTITKEAIARRDALQKIVDKLKVEGWVLNLDKLAYEEQKAAAKK